MQIVGPITSEKLVDKDGSKLEFYSPEFLLIVQGCLIELWVGQGIERQTAEREALKGVAKILLNAKKEKWCLLPEI